MFGGKDDTLVTDFRRRAPQNLRPKPGHLTSEVLSPRSLANLDAAATPESDVAQSNYVKYKSEEQNSVMRRAEEQKRDMEMLRAYNPWGKPGGGAPGSEDQKLCGLNPDVNRNHDDSNPAYCEQFGKPGNGAPLRSDEGQPLSIVRRHPDIRNQPELFNDELKKKSSNTGLQPLPQYNGTNGAPLDRTPQYPLQDHSHRQQNHYNKPQMLGPKPHPTDETTKMMLRSKLDQQIAEKRDSKVNESIVDPTSDYYIGQGVVGTIQRDQSGKLVRSNPLGGRDVDGVRGFSTHDLDAHGLIYELGKPGPGNPTRTRSGNIHPAPRGILAKDTDDPFRIGRQSLSPRDPRHNTQVFPTHLEQEASDRASKRNPAVSPISNIHTRENGYYTGEPGSNQEPAQHVPVSQSDPGQRQVGTVYSAGVRARENYLHELSQQIEEKKVMKDQEKRKSLADDEQFIKSAVYNDVFGKPGNGAPRLNGGNLQLSRKRLDEIETQGCGVQNPQQFRK